MNILLVSDTHGNTAFLQEVMNSVLSEYDVECLYHLGDFFEDPLQIDRGDTYVYRVPGIYHEGYKSGILDGVLGVSTMGFEVLLVHDLSDVTPENRIISDIIMYGHTHTPNLELVNNVLYVNPGHLKAAVDRGNTASYAMLSLEENRCAIDIFQYGGGILRSIEVEKVHEQLIVV
ncbi:metallophosphoesterase family protein [Chitinivibrio alkaliphilus]|uniref:Phosphodiesterase, MJ0936 family n=1 Tax=Chitinivibrio alkaliphilus ACht1 TaxID=1313304 RepID=U7D9D9_9BACT|nr:metallophosphoesterase family protein [Chitinivibrio alkaliphilus]ERP31707.1 phosphodiesterase, MJ0936 family [Chitinivibrio alkaliphilus ACht1]